MLIDPLKAFMDRELEGLGVTNLTRSRVGDPGDQNVVFYFDWKGHPWHVLWTPEVGEHPYSMIKRELKRIESCHASCRELEEG